MLFSGLQPMAILAALVNGDLTAQQLITKVNSNTGGRVKISTGSIYTQLARLEKHGLVRGYYGDDKSESRGGRPKRYYEIIAAGAGTLNDLDSIRGIGHA